jgi:ubiquinone biosynthesis protein UbiJ
MTAEAIAALRDEMRAGFAEIRAELASVRGELANVRTRVDGVPILGVAIETLRHDVRTLRAAINDMARINITAGEVEALHADVDRMGTKQIELEARLSALERGPV